MAILSKLPAAELRTILLAETKKFVTALENGCPLDELEIMRVEIRGIMDILDEKEKEEGKKATAHPHKNKART